VAVSIPLRVKTPQFPAEAPPPPPVYDRSR
jgi:hypothetical protein